jgi:hypothetical protein
VPAGQNQYVRYRRNTCRTSNRPKAQVSKYRTLPEISKQAQLCALGAASTQIFCQIVLSGGSAKPKRGTPLRTRYLLFTKFSSPSKNV